jgi:predicted nucleic acid-binding Zn ribbon protein
MPIYVYRDKETDKKVEVIRDFKDYQIEPSVEEAKDYGLTDDEYSKATWERILGTGIQMTRGDNWTGSKGNW